MGFLEPVHHCQKGLAMLHILRILFGAAALSISFSNPTFAQNNDALSAQFSDAIANIANHGVSVVPASDGGHLVVLETSFDTRSTVSLRLLLGSNGRVAPEADLGPLRKITGLQVFRIPSDLDISGYNEVYVWNPKDSAVIGVAPLN